MRPLTFSGFVTAALAAVLFSYVIGLGGGQTGLQSILSEDEYELAGLDKLTDEEQTALFTFLCIPRRDFLVETAMRRMEADRWKAVSVIGYGVRKEDTPSPERYLVVYSGEPHRFQIPLSSGDLAPGTYWAKTDSHVWTLLRPNGSTDNLWPLSEN